MHVISQSIEYRCLHETDKEMKHSFNATVRNEKSLKIENNSSLHVKPFGDSLFLLEHDFVLGFFEIGMGYLQIWEYLLSFSYYLNPTN